jgi:hypothetical protein
MHNLSLRAVCCCRWLPGRSSIKDPRQGVYLPAAVVATLGLSGTVNGSTMLLDLHVEGAEVATGVKARVVG